MKRIEFIEEAQSRLKSKSKKLRISGEARMMIYKSVDLAEQKNDGESERIFNRAVGMMMTIDRETALKSCIEIFNNYSFAQS